MHTTRSGSWKRPASASAAEPMSEEVSRVCGLVRLQVSGFLACILAGMCYTNSVQQGQKGTEYESNRDQG